MESANVHHILCIEGEADNLGLFVKWLELSGYKATPADSFSKALDLALNYPFDLYLVGDSLPRGREIEFARQIRAADQQTPIVICSSMAFPSDIEEGLSVGAQAYLTKPCKPETLERAIRRAIRQSYYESLDAKRAELRAICEELSLRNRESVEPFDRASSRLTQAEETLLRIKARAAFLAAGGTRANFERFWPEVLSAAIASTV
jgi:two-component system cell cycle response regulator DivK